MIHDLKISPNHYYNVVAELKKAELRLNDRCFSVGDLVLLRVYETDKYSNESVLVRITHILKGGKYGLSKGYIMMSIELVTYEEWRALLC